MGSILDRFKENVEEIRAAVSDRKIKVGIIGTGWIAEAHVANYLKCPDVEIVAPRPISSRLYSPSSIPSQSQSHSTLILGP